MASGDEDWFDDLLFSPDLLDSSTPEQYSNQAKLHNKVIDASCDDSLGDKESKLHTSKNTANSVAMHGDVPENVRKGFFWKASNVMKVNYDPKYALAYVGVAAVLACRGDWTVWKDNMKNYKGRSGFVIPGDFLTKWIDRFFPGLTEAIEYIDTRLATFRGLSDKEKRNLGHRLLKWARDTCKGMVLLFKSFLRNLPWKMDRYADKWGVWRRIVAVRELRADPDWQLISDGLRRAHQTSIDDYAYDHMTPRERDALQAKTNQELIAEAMRVGAAAAMKDVLPKPETPLYIEPPIKFIEVEEPRPKKKQKIQGDAPIYDTKIDNVRGLYDQYYCGGGTKWQNKETTRLGKTVEKTSNHSNKGHLPQRVHVLVETGMALENACEVYNRVRQDFGLSTIPKLEEAVQLAEPIYNGPYRGRPKTKTCLNKLPDITKDKILACIVKNKEQMWVEIGGVPMEMS